MTIDNRDKLPRRRVSTLTIRQFILDEVGKHPDGISRLIQETFDISRQTASRHLKGLTNEGILVAAGNTYARKYSLRQLSHETMEFIITPDLAEDVVWRERISPLLGEIPENVLTICNHGFTEMFNNAISHSEGTRITVDVSRTATEIQMGVIDDGVGIFNKITSELHLTDPRHALLELSKGKLTTDASQHTGEGIFFTSRMFDEFTIGSTPLYFSRERIDDEDWLLETALRTGLIGTGIGMVINTNSRHTAREIFDQFASGQDNYGFTKTHVPVKLAKYERDQLISRSAARRVLARFENFREVLLDFDGVESIGQAFADEIFRVYRNAHPNIDVIPVRMSSEVADMVGRAMFQSDQ